MKYTLINRKKSVVAESDKEFVAWMRKYDLQFWKDNQNFMEGYAHRKKLFENIELLPNSENSFVESLKENNLLRVEKQNTPKIFRFFLKK